MNAYELMPLIVNSEDLSTVSQVDLMEVLFERLSNFNYKLTQAIVFQDTMINWLDSTQLLGRRTYSRVGRRV